MQHNIKLVTTALLKFFMVGLLCLDHFPPLNRNALTGLSPTVFKISQMIPLKYNNNLKNIGCYNGHLTAPMPHSLMIE